MRDLAQRILAELDRRLEVIRAAPNPDVEQEVFGDQPILEWSLNDDDVDGQPCQIGTLWSGNLAAFIVASRNERERELLAIRDMVGRLASEAQYLNDTIADAERQVAANHEELELRVVNRELRAIARRLGIKEE